MARQFDLSAPSRGIQMEAQIGQIQSQAQNTAMSFYERQQNMRLKELQNNRQQMLAETQIKMNEANLSIAEGKLELQKSTQDALVNKAEYDMELSKMDLAQKKKYMEESQKVMARIPEYSTQVDEIVNDAFMPDREKRDKLLTLTGQMESESLAYKELAPNISGIKSVAEIQIQEINNRLNLKRQEQLFDIQMEQYQKAKELSGVTEGQKFDVDFDPKTGTMRGVSQGGLASQASGGLTEKEADKIFLEVTDDVVDKRTRVSMQPKFEAKENLPVTVFHLNQLKAFPEKYKAALSALDKNAVTPEQRSIYKNILTELGETGSNNTNTEPSPSVSVPKVSTPEEQLEEIKRSMGLN